MVESSRSSAGPKEVAGVAGGPRWSPPRELQRRWRAATQVARDAIMSLPAAGGREGAASLGQVLAESPAQPFLLHLSDQAEELVGRTVELAEAQSALERGRRGADPLQHAGAAGEVPVVVVHGPPGIGTSAFAMQLARWARPLFPDGQLAVDLGQLLQALGARPREVPDELLERARRYRSLLADRRALVLVERAADAEQVRALLPSSPGCAMIVTTRAPLGGLVTAARCRIAPLPERDAVELLAARSAVPGSTTTRPPPLPSCAGAAATRWRCASSAPGCASTSARPCHSTAWPRTCATAAHRAPATTSASAPAWRSPTARCPARASGCCATSACCQPPSWTPAWSPPSPAPPPRPPCGPSPSSPTRRWSNPSARRPASVPASPAPLPAGGCTSWCGASPPTRPPAWSRPPCGAPPASACWPSTSTRPTWPGPAAPWPCRSGPTAGSVRAPTWPRPSTGRPRSSSTTSPGGWRCAAPASSTRATTGTPGCSPPSAGRRPPRRSATRPRRRPPTRT